jgi:Glycosyl hydrolase family 79, N-terminal domain
MFRSTSRASSRDPQPGNVCIPGGLIGLIACLTSTVLVALVCPQALAGAPSVTPATMAWVGTVDERFQSYNVEMVEVTGGRFWKPYEPNRSDAPSDLYEYRKPIDLTDARLRRLARALAPAYLRVSGTWANATYFADSDTAPSAAPPGFDQVLSRQQWRGVVKFSQAVGAQIVTSFAVSPGARSTAGVWASDQALRLLSYTRRLGGSIAAAEFMNEPNLARAGTTGFGAAEYGRDFNLFYSFLKTNFSEILVLGPGTVGETADVSPLLAASAPDAIDALSYHYYGKLSERCGGANVTAAALSEQWLAGTEQTLNFYRGLRNQYAPGKPIWLTETAQAACGGDRWAATFRDTFRYLDQLGRLARAGVQVVMHNTLAASDYGLLDENTFAPRPNYWGALLWRRLMGRTVLEAGVPAQTGFHVYAHCHYKVRGGVSLLIINTSTNAPQRLMLSSTSNRYTLHAASLAGRTLRLNGRKLKLDNTHQLPALKPIRGGAGILTFAPATITFLAIPDAANSACR